MLITSLLMTITLLTCAALAAWPLLLARMLRPALQSLGGLLCIAAGSVGFFAIASGLAGTFSSSQAIAVEPAATADDPVESDDTSLYSLPEAMPEDIVTPPGRPAWVESKPVREGSLHSLSVKSGPFKRDSDARRKLDEQLELQTKAYIAEILGSNLAPQFIRYDASQIRGEFVKKDKNGKEYIYHETLVSPSVGSMEQYHALIEFPRGFQEQIRHQWDEVKAKWRLAQVGLIAGGAILLLSTVFGYFRVDNATRGYYTGRLQFLSAAAILAIVGAGVFFARWIHWL
jgi:hypothetical protein